MYNLFSMTKIYILFISHYDFSHTEFKLKSIHTSHSYIIRHHDLSYTEFKRRFGRAQRGKFQKRILSVARQLLFQTPPVNKFSHTEQS